MGKRGRIARPCSPLCAVDVKWKAPHLQTQRKETGMASTVALRAAPLRMRGGAVEDDERVCALSSGGARREGQCSVRCG